jgi:hypothetical protein
VVDPPSPRGDGRGELPHRHHAFLLFSWVRGIAALVTGGVLGPEAVDQLITDAVTTFNRGSAAPLPGAP